MLRTQRAKEKLAAKKLEAAEKAVKKAAKEAKDPTAVFTTAEESDTPEMPNIEIRRQPKPWEVLARAKEEEEKGPVDPSAKPLTKAQLR